MELFDRAIKGKDIATGLVDVKAEYPVTEGTAKSTFREGNSTLIFEVLPSNSTYNTTTNRPDDVTSKRMKKMELKKRGEGILSPGKKFKLSRGF